MNTPHEVPIRRLQAGDAPALLAFYTGLSPASLRTFRPLGPATTLEICEGVVSGNGADIDSKYDLAVWEGERMVGWGFVWKMGNDDRMFGLAVADTHQGRGLGGLIMRQVLAGARKRESNKIILTAVKDNLPAIGLYEKNDFVRYGEYVDEKDGLTYLRMALD